MEEYKIVNDFVDGTIEPELEEQLFRLLSNKVDARTELKEQLALKEAIKNDVRAFTPSADSTRKIFTTLGFTAPVAMLTPDNVAGQTPHKPFLKKYKQGFISAVTTTAAAIIIYFLLLRPGVTESIAKNDQLIRKNTIENNQTPAIKSFENQPHHEQKNKTRTVVKYIYVPVQNIDNQSVSSANTIIEENTTNHLSSEKDISFFKKPNINLANSINKVVNSYPKVYNASSNNKDLFTYIKPEANNIGITAELRGTQYWTFEDSLISPKHTARFNNSSIALFYNISDNMMIGFDMRQETFYQDYFVRDDLNNLYLYEQKPNFTTYCGALRYVWDDNGVIPILSQISLGGTNAGYIVRGMIGTQYSPAPSISLILGLEYSNLIYRHNSTSYNSPKIGINYGVSFKF